MKFNAILLLSIAILATIVSAETPQAGGAKKGTFTPGVKPFPTPEDDFEHRTTAKSTTTTAATSTSTTTTEGTSTSTAAPETSTTPTTSTTPAPKTTPATTTTTAPITTPATTTTAAPPVPTPDPAMGKWNLSDNGNVCIILYAAIQLKFTYNTTENVSRTVLHNVPAELTNVVPGTCGNDTQNQEIVVQWGPASSQSSFLVLFSLNSTTHEYALKEIKIALNTVDLPGGRNETLTFWNTENTFIVPKGMSYHCTRNQTLNLTDDEKSNKTVAWAFVSHVQVEAYHKGNKAQFSYAKDCDAIDTPDIVPIAVGCALIALVIVVLIAYLVGRRRAQARGYISM